MFCFLLPCLHSPLPRVFTHYCFKLWPFTRFLATRKCCDPITVAGYFHHVACRLNLNELIYETDRVACEAWLVYSGLERVNCRYVYVLLHYDRKLIFCHVHDRNRYYSVNKYNYYIKLLQWKVQQINTHIFKWSSHPSKIWLTPKLTIIV